MGNCKSLHYEDDDDRILHLRNKQMKKELQEFQKQLRLQKCFSELDMSGRPKARKENTYQGNPNLTPEQTAKAMSIVYDA